jgi:BTB/POZ domain
MNSVFFYIPDQSIRYLNPTMIDPRSACDVTFLVGPEKRPVQGNKTGLAFASTVFHRMFFSDFPSQNEIEVPDVDANAFELMLNSVSGRDVIIDADNVAQVYYAAEKYDFPFLRRVCKTFVVNSIDSKKALTILNTYQQYNDSEINEKCLAFILDDPLSFFGKPEFLEAPADVVRSIFKPIHINCSSQDIWNALKDWISNKKVRCNKNEKNWVEAVENQLKITRAELEMKSVRRNVFTISNFTFSRFQHSLNSFDLGSAPLSLQGFGLIIGRVPQETIRVDINNASSGDHLSRLYFTVENKIPTNEVSIQNVFFQRIPISQGKLTVKIKFDTTMYRPCIHKQEEFRCIAYFLVSSIQPTEQS